MSRTYDQYSPVARALELVGERWPLLAARELLIDAEVLHVQVRDGNLQPHHGPADDPDAGLTIDATALADLSAGRLDIDNAFAAGRVTVDGNEDAARRLLTSFSGLPNRVT